MVVKVIMGLRCPPEAVAVAYIKVDRSTELKKPT
jgi:hypothetical protein